MLAIDRFCWHAALDHAATVQMLAQCPPCTTDMRYLGRRGDDDLELRGTMSQPFADVFGQGCDARATAAGNVLVLSLLPIRGQIVWARRYAAARDFDSPAALVINALSPQRGRQPSLPTQTQHPKSGKYQTLLAG